MAVKLKRAHTAAIGRSVEVRGRRARPAPDAFLGPAQIATVRHQALVRTVLGSCVSAVLYHRPSRTAMLCHAVLPCCPHAHRCPGPGGCQELYRYVECVLPYMLDRLAAQGIRARDLDIGLYGGATVIAILGRGRGGQLDVGRRNSAAARAFFKAKGLRVREDRLGADCGCRILFDAASGTTRVEFLPGMTTAVT